MTINLSLTGLFCNTKTNYPSFSMQSSVRSRSLDWDSEDSSRSRSNSAEPPKHRRLRKRPIEEESEEESPEAVLERGRKPNRNPAKSKKAKQAHRRVRSPSGSGSDTESPAEEEPLEEQGPLNHLTDFQKRFCNLNSDGEPGVTEKWLKYDEDKPCTTFHIPVAEKVRWFQVFVWEFIQKYNSSVSYPTPEMLAQALKQNKTWLPLMSFVSENAKQFSLLAPKMPVPGPKKKNPKPQEQPDSEASSDLPDTSTQPTQVSGPSINRVLDPDLGDPEVSPPSPGPVKNPLEYAKTVIARANEMAAREIQVHKEKLARADDPQSQQAVQRLDRTLRELAKPTETPRPERPQRASPVRPGPSEPVDPSERMQSSPRTSPPSSPAGDPTNQDSVSLDQQKAMQYLNMVSDEVLRDKLKACIENLTTKARRNKYAK